MKNRQVLGGIVAYGGLISLAIVLGTFKAPFKILAIGSLTAVPFAVAAQLVAENRCESRVKVVDGELDKLIQENRNLQQSKQRLDAVMDELNRTQSELLECDKARIELVAKINEQSLLVTGLKLENQKLTNQLNDYEESYATSLDIEVQQGIQAYKDNHKTQLEAKYRYLLDEAQEITTQAMKLPHKYKDWGEKVADRLVSQKGYILGLTKDFNYAIDEAQSSWSDERDGYLKQIEIYQEQLGRLQQHLAGDLTEPSYLECGYSVDGRIANDLAKEIWRALNIPLAVKGYQVKSDGSTEIGYGYSRSANPETLVEALKRQSGDIAKSLRIHKISNIRKLEIDNLIVVSCRREPAIKEDELRRLLTPIEKLATQVIREMSRKGTVRIMGATGDGKGVCARYLLSRIILLEDWYIRLHDPQDGSAQDYWGIPKVSRSGQELKKTLRNISAQMAEREASKNHSPITLDILDEIDTQLEKDDKGQFLNLISRIRHLGMKMILIGQNPKVSRAGFQWADMEQMIAFYQGSSALDAIRSNPALELKRDILLRQYEEISSVLQAKNEWLDDAKKHYFGLCVIPGKSPQWYELPIADTIEIDPNSNLIASTFEIVDSNPRFVESENSGQLLVNSVINISDFPRSGSDKSLAGQGFSLISDKTGNGGGAGKNGKTGKSGKATCKRHPSAELRAYSDGRFYCTSCKKRLNKSGVEYL